MEIRAMTWGDLQSFVFRLRLRQPWVALATVMLTLWPVAHAAPRVQGRLYLHPTMKSGAKAPRVFVLLPPTAARTVSGTVRVLRTEDAADLSQQFTKLVVDAFAQNGWQIDRDSLAEQSVAGDAKLRNLVAFLRERHAQMVRELLSRPKDVTRGKFTFGPDVAELGARAPADALVLVHIDASTPPKLGLAWLAAGSFGTAIPGLKRVQWDKLGAPQISLVDAVSGDVLCFIRLGAHLPESPDALTRVLKQVPR